MRASEIRQAFLDFYAARGHQVVPSGPLVPQGDATLMFANAGMVQFKRALTGEEKRPYSRAVTAQKCMRVSGKHNDLEEVGRSPRHQTFFEMLGNFSFGDYFKKEAIEFGWELLTEIYGIDPDQLVVSVHRDDDDAFALWRDLIGIEPGRIFRLDDKENFWQMGDTGPCGPCSEIHMITDRAAFEGGADPSQEGYSELYNLVFMQFEQTAGGERKPLPAPSVDTGLGLERTSTVLQGVNSNYETDLFVPLVERTAELADYRYGSSDERDVSVRVIADHARACAFLIGEGVRPGNEGRSYVLRRVLRRAARHGVLLGLEEPFLFEVAKTVIAEMGEAYPELVERRAFIEDTIVREEERFGRTLTRGLSMLDDEVALARREKRAQLSGAVVFKLYDTFGFPTDLTEDILRGRDLDYDRAGFEAAMAEQAERARAAWKGSGEGAPAEIYAELVAEGASEFIGYEQLTGTGIVRALLRDGARADEVREGERVEVVVDVTPFYAESGGQVGDRGAIAAPGGRVEVEDTQRPVEGLIVHAGRVAIGGLCVGDSVELEVDAAARAATVRNHSGTHLLHCALREVLGEQVTQAGSLVAPDRLRFDITHDDPLEPEQIRAIEDRANALILENFDAQVEEMGYNDAIAAGAMAMFSEKYGERVRVVRFGPSVELCGGTHASKTGDIGSLRITGQSAIGAGVRRLEAQTGMGAIEYARAGEGVLRETSQALRAAPAEIAQRVRKLLERQKELERELEKTRAQMRRGGSADPLSQAQDVGGVKVVAAEVPDATAKELRGLVDELKQRVGSGVVMLAVRSEDKAALACGVTPDLTDRFKAGALVKQVAEMVGGSGGGRPDFAQAGGSDPSAVPAALERFVEIVRDS